MIIITTMKTRSRTISQCSTRHCALNLSSPLKKIKPSSLAMLSFSPGVDWDVVMCREDMMTRTDTRLVVNSATVTCSHYLWRWCAQSFTLIPEWLLAACKMLAWGIRTDINSGEVKMCLLEVVLIIPVCMRCKFVVCLTDLLLSCLFTVHWICLLVLFFVYNTALFESSSWKRTSKCVWKFLLLFWIDWTVIVSSSFQLWFLSCLWNYRFGCVLNVKLLYNVDNSFYN